MFLGDYDPSAIIDKKFSSFGTSPVTLGGTPTVGILKSNGTALTTLGVTLTTDFGGRTGSNHLRADLSQDTAFYATGNDFDAIFLTGTVGGTSVVGLPIISFSINHRSPLRPTTAQRTLPVDAAGFVTSIVSGNITGSVANLTNITGPVTVTTNLDKGGYTAAVSGNITGSVANLTNITGPVTVTTVIDKGGYTASVSGNITGSVALVNTLTTYTGNTPQTGDVYARIGATGSGLTSITSKTDNLPSDPADESLIIAATDAIMTRIGAGGGSLTALPALLTTSTMTEAYAADGAAFSIAQGMYQVWSTLSELFVSGTSIYNYRLDGTTTAMLSTIDSTSTPTMRHRVG